MTRCHAAVLASFVVALVGCSSANESNNGKSVSMATLFEAEVGFSLADVNSASLEATAQSVRDCLSTRGFVPIEETITDSSIRNVAAPSVGKLTETIAQQTLAPSRDKGDDQGNTTTDAAYLVALQECNDQASQEIRDPSLEFLQWIQQSDSDIASRVHGDDSVAQAKEVLKTCLAALGVSGSSEDDVNSYFIGKAIEVADSFISGQITDVAAETSFKELSDAERKLEEPIKLCLSDFDKVYSSVVDREQSRFLNNNQEAAIEELHRLRDEFLPKIESNLSGS